MTFIVKYPFVSSSNAWIVPPGFIGGSTLIQFISSRSAIDTDAIVAMPYNGYIPPPPPPEVVEKRCAYCNAFVTEWSEKHRECEKCGGPV